MLTSVFITFASIFLSIFVARYMSWVLEPEISSGWRKRFEMFSAKLLGANAQNGQDWKTYSVSLLVFNSAMFAFAYTILSCQQFLPLNPDNKTEIEWSLIFHTVASFTSNTNLQHYSGEVSLSYFSQVAALMWLQFVSAATGIATLAAISRGLTGRQDLGNFFLDLWRVTTLLLLPLALLLACLLCLLGLPMTFEGALSVTTLEGATQTIARGPVAVFVAIKQLGTNGGGFFGANSAHPFENPTYWSNILSTISILLLPMSCVWAFGRLTGRRKHAQVVFSVMALMLIALASASMYFETFQPASATGLQLSEQGNLEGKEIRFGTSASSLWATATTMTSNGSVNAMMDSLQPLSSLIAMTGMWMNVIFGGVGVGILGMLLYIIVAVFISGMMVGRTPEYFSRKVEAHEMKLAVFGLLLHPLLILGGFSFFCLTSFGLSTIQETGSHGFSEILYEFSSASANNGSGFEGLGDNSIAWNTTTGIIMLLARYLPILLPLAIVGSLASKNSVIETSGTLKVDTPLFGIVLLGTILIIGALLFLPFAILGPVAEHLITKI